MGATLAIRAHTRRTNRLFVLDGGELWAISVFVALDDVGTGSTKAILQTKLRSYGHVWWAGDRWPRMITIDIPAAPQL